MSIEKERRIVELAALAANDFVIVGTKSNQLEEVAASKSVSLSVAAQIVVNAVFFRFEQLPFEKQQECIEYAKMLDEVMDKIGGETVLRSLNLKDYTIQGEYGAKFHREFVNLHPGIYTNSPFPMLPKSIQKSIIRQLTGLQIWLKADLKQF